MTNRKNWTSKLTLLFETQLKSNYMKDDTSSKTAEAAAALRALHYLY